jgi:uncharacterized protein YgiM (DUF1202 family)
MLHFQANRWLAVAGFLGIVLNVRNALAQTDAPTAPGLGVGTVTANDVYVRSGDSLNHYTISKLNAGDQVTVVSERGEWYEIVPPEGTFSLVSGDFVDTTDNQAGVINGDNVRVRAGSLLNENKYTVQNLLTKGTPVTILGRNPDGFVRIKPPPGATVWINRSFVTLSGAAAATAQPADATDAAPKATTEGATSVPQAVQASAAKSAEKLAAPMPAAATTPLRRQVEEIDVAARTELAKPIEQRQFEPIAKRYEPIASQSDDTFAQQYAKTRLEQINHLAELTRAVDKMRAVDQEATSKRRDFLAERGLIPEPQPETTPAGIEVRGELRISALYPPGSPTPRYRLLDPNDPNERTIGYIEIPKDATISVEPFLGKFVGVRASAQRIQAGGVDPIPIYIARELMLMETDPRAASSP